MGAATSAISSIEASSASAAVSGSGPSWGTVQEDRRTTHSRAPPLRKNPLTACARTLAALTLPRPGSPNLRVYSAQLVTSCGAPAGARRYLLPLGRLGMATSSGTTPTKLAVLVLTPAIGALPDGTSSTYTPGEK